MIGVMISILNVCISTLMFMKIKPWIGMYIVSLLMKENFNWLNSFRFYMGCVKNISNLRVNNDFR